MAITVSIYMLNSICFFDFMPLKPVPTYLQETSQSSPIYWIILLEMTLISLRELAQFFFIWLMNSLTQPFDFLTECLSAKASFLSCSRLSSDNIYFCVSANRSRLLRKPLKGECVFNPLILFLRIVNRLSQEFLLSLAS